MIVLNYCCETEVVCGEKYKGFDLFDETQIHFHKMGTIYRGQEDYSFSLSENEIRSDQQVVLLTEAKGALFQENKIFAGTQIWSSSSVTFNQNTIKADHRDDILLTKENTDITLENNNLQVDSDMDCI